MARHAQHVRNGRLGKQARQRRVKERIAHQRAIKEERWNAKLALLGPLDRELALLPGTSVLGNREYDQ